MRYDVLLFDIDGTLVDSAPDICGAVQTVLEGIVEAGGAPPAAYPQGVPFAFLRSYIGRHLADLFATLYPEAGPPQVEAWIAAYRVAYLARGHAGTRLYPGVAATLPGLPGRKSTATTKSSATSRAVLERFGLAPCFEHIQGTDGFPAKPKPDVILRALAGLGAPADRCLFVGDSEPDMEAGRAAGVHLCAVRYGYGRPDALARYEPELMVDEFAELGALLR